MKILNFFRAIFSKEKITFKCRNCKAKEDIPKSIVTFLDFLDKGNSDYPPRFTCKMCMGPMEPIHYISYRGIVYKYKK